MNKYAARGILVDAMGGTRFLIVERDHHAVHAAVRIFAEEATALTLPVRVRRANGDERVDMPGRGTIRFTTPRSNRHRGLLVDVVFVDNDAHRVLDGDDPTPMRRFFEDVAPVLNATGGEFVHS